MKIFDMHIHANNTKPDANDILKNFDLAGVSGGCILSTSPVFEGKEISFEQRMDELKGWTSSAPDRLYPVLWIDPYEKDVYKKIEKAVNEGITAFKIICDGYYVYEKKVLKVLSLIAEANKPVIFHTGILWDGKDSSKYNRPLNWEPLINIKNLRFSMGHCSWPWHDECISLYGKFLHGLTNDENAPEMFLDLTPGTPIIYREDLLRKIYTIGYDVPDNVMFGTDSSAECYNNGNWVTNWINLDNEIYQKLNMGEKLKSKIYNDNAMRFLGITKNKVKHLNPTPDNANTWTIEMEK